MDIRIFEDKQVMGKAAGEYGADLIRRAIQQRGTARIVVATGASQFEVLKELAQADGIAWNRVTMFHLDEYIGLPIEHPASFRNYLWNRFVRHLPMPPAVFHYIDAERDASGECARLGALIARATVDVAFIGIGENGHLAFNDPPADFDTEVPYLVVQLDEACRRQQLGEGWFSSLEDVPTQAISMSVRQIMKAASLVCTVPDMRKAEAVRNALKRAVTPLVPASILRTHSDAGLFLDASAASLLDEAQSRAM